MEKELNEFMNLIINDEFFKAHEVLEAIWFPIRKEKDNLKMKLLKAFINSAVSFELIKRGRVDASKIPWNVYKKYISNLNTLKDKEELKLYLKVVTLVEDKNTELNQPSLAGSPK